MNEINNNNAPQNNPQNQSGVTNTGVSTPSLNQGVNTNPSPQIDNQPRVAPASSSIPNTGMNQSTNSNSAPVEPKKPEATTPNSPKKPAKKSFAGIFVFILLCGFIFCLPYINDYQQAQKTKQQQELLEEQLKREEEQQKQEEQEREEELEEQKKIKTTVCTSPSSNQGAFTLTEEQTIKHKEDKIISVSVAHSRTYLQEQAEYESMKQTCQSKADPLTNPVQDGYSVDCEIDNLTITLTETFDLEIFKTFTTDAGETISAPYSYQQSLSEVLKALEANQNVCK